MSPKPSSSTDHSANDLEHFFAWVAPLAFGFAALFSVICLVSGNSWVSVLALATFAVGCVLLVGRAWVRRGAIQQAVVLSCISLLAANLMAAAIEPISAPTLVILPLLVATMALPYLAGRALGWLLCLCWLTGAIVAVLGEIIEPHTPLPPSIASALRVVLIIASVSTALLLLWQYSNRLARTLAEMRSANAALRESELRYRNITEITADVIYSLRVDQSGEPVLEWASDSFADTIGYSLDDIRQHDTWLKVLHPDDRAIEERHGIAVMAGHSDVSEYRIITKTGDVRWLRDQARPEWDDTQARVVRILAAATDITERKRAEESLRESRALLQLVADVVPVMIAYVDAKLRFHFANRGYLEWFGLPEEDLIGHDMRDLFSEQLFTLIKDYIDLALAGEQVSFEPAPFERAGKAHTIRVVYIPDRGQAGEVLGFVIMVQDITERRQAEEQRLALERKMLETQRLESIGVLAGGVAHDFNNLLTAIVGNAGLALLDLPRDSGARESAERILQAAKQAADLTKQMLAYSGRGHFLIRPLDLNMIIAESRGLIDASLGPRIELRYNLAPTLPAIEADAEQLRQVLLNLVLNAAEAIDEQAGEIELHTTTISAAQAGLEQLELTPDQSAEEYVVLRVSDTGDGMAAETRTRMFDPFFSTKFTGRGLGLAAVLGIVRGHHGGLHVQSAPSQGTVVTVLLPSMPRVPAPTEDAPASEPSASAPLAASHTILVVDDDPAVRTVAARMLERLGYTVLQAADGHSAIELFQINHATIALIVLDLVMPQLSGEQVLAEIQRIKPDARVVVMSGYTSHEAAQLVSTPTSTSFLQKPFTAAELRSLIRDVLGIGTGAGAGDPNT